MKRVLMLVTIIAMVSGFSLQANADLNLIGQGTSAHGMYNLIYDTDLDVTWYDYTNAVDTWQNQVDWAGGLSVTFGVNTYTNWRLPVSDTCLFYNCTGSEMGHLYYTELGNPAEGPLNNTRDFQNLIGGLYWSGTEDPDSTSYAFGFWFGSGTQTTGSKPNVPALAIAVRPGLAVMPEPISYILFIVGSTTLGYMYFRKKRKSV